MRLLKQRKSIVLKMRLLLLQCLAQGSNKALLLPLKSLYEDWQSQIVNDGLDEIDATIIRLAVDGLWLSEVLE